MNAYSHNSSTPSRPMSGRFTLAAGFSMVELMISIAIGLFLLAGITALIVQQSTTHGELEKSSRQIENGRYAIEVLREDIQLAGYWGEYGAISTAPGVPAALPDPCSLAVAGYTDTLAIHFQGYNNPGAALPTPPSGCLASANHLAGTDILVVRRAGTSTVPVTTAAPNTTQPYIQTGQDTTAAMTYKLAVGGSSFPLTNATGAVVPVRPYIVNIYFISPCSVATGAGASGNPNTCSAADDTIPTLKRLKLEVPGAAGSALAFTMESLVEGIENMQIDYGIDTSADASKTGAADCYVSDPSAPDGTETAACSATATTYFATALAAGNAPQKNWSNVMTVRVNLLARNLDQTASHTDKKIYKLGLAGDFGPFNDKYKRHAFSAVIRAVNPSGRREK